MTFFEKFNEQMNFEFESAYIYRTMAAYMADMDLDGFEHFFDMQVNEELIHAEDFKNALQRLGQKVKYRPLDPGTGEFEGIEDVFKKALEHEKLVSSKIKELYEESLSQPERYATVFLQKYLDEQVEEEETFTKLITQLERVHGNWAGIYQLDALLASRPMPQADPTM
ncbi:MAG: ferritin [Tissierellia bacterium]|nr:ferritin [Tissierellia bacterium]